MQLVNVGFGNMINAERVIAIVTPDSAPVKRMMQTAKDCGKLIDVTQGRKTAAVIFTDSEHVILSYMKTERLLDRFNKKAEEDITAEE